MTSEKPIIYQLLPDCLPTRATTVPNGTIQQNGSGKMNDITKKPSKA